MEYNIRRSDAIPEATGAEIKMGKVLIYNGRNLKWGSSESLRGKDGFDGNDGLNGEEVTLQKTATHIQWRLGAGSWSNLVALSDLKGKDGSEVQMQMTATHIQWRLGTGTWANLLSLEAIQKPALDAAKEAKTATNEATEAAKKANTAAENVKDGKTPVLSTGVIKDGDTASGELKPDGVDENDNPKYVLDITLPKGKDGKAPVITFGAVTTLEPNEDAKATVTSKGLDENEHPIFEISLSIPRGEKGLHGDGSGNVFTDITNLEANKKYLFVPDANNSPSGEFVEYVEQDVTGEVKAHNESLNAHQDIREEIPSKVSELSNDVKYQKEYEVATTVDSAVKSHNESVEAHSDIRQLLIDYLTTSKGYTDEKIKALIGAAPEELDTIYELAAAISEHKDIIDALNSAIGSKLGKTDTAYNSDRLGGQLASTFAKAGDITELLAYVAFMTKFQTITSLTNIPVNVTRVYEYNLTANATLSLAALPKSGYDQIIKIKNTSTGELTVTLPSSATYENEFGTALKIGAGKIAEVNFLALGSKCSIRVGESI